MADAENKGLMVRFFVLREKNEAKTLVEGRDVWDEIEAISVRVAGSRDEMVNAANDEYRRRFADEYKAFKTNQAAPLTGTPLSEWPGASTSFIDEMRVYGIRTLEQLAEMSDGVAMINPGWMTMRTRAQTFLEQAKTGAVAESLAVQNDALKQQLANMQAQMDRLSAMLPPPAQADQAAALHDPGPVPEPETADVTAEAATKKK